MTSDFMTPPHSIEAEQSVLGGLLLEVSFVIFSFKEAGQQRAYSEGAFHPQAGIVLLASAPGHFC